MEKILQIFKFEITFQVFYLFLGLNLILMIIPTYRKCKKRIRFYQTPFLYVFFFNSMNFLFGGVIAFYFSFFYSDYIVWISMFLGQVVIFIIIFGDRELKFKFKILILLCYLIIESFFFFFPTISIKNCHILFYVSHFFLSVAPVECLFWFFYLKQYFILPIINLFFWMCFNAFSILNFMYYGATEILLFNTLGIISCLIEIILYFVYRCKRKTNALLQTDNNFAQIENFTP